MSEYTGNDIYCDLIIPSKMPVKIVKETKNILAFHHSKPFWPTHIVVTCRHHLPSLLELDPAQGKELLEVIQEIAKQVQEQDGACRVLTNLGRYQDSKHLHVHISSGQPL